jgi:hypothetical protein
MLIGNSKRHDVVICREPAGCHVGFDLAARRMSWSSRRAHVG